MFLGNIFRFADLLVEAHIEQKVDLLLARLQIRFAARDGGCLPSGRRLALLFKLPDHPVGDCGFQRHLLNRAVNLHGNGLLPDVFLGAWHNALGAVQIIVAFLRFGGDEAAAFAAPEKAAIHVRLQLGGLVLAFLRHDLLHTVKQALGNNRLVLALVQLAVEGHHAVEKGILERPLVIRNGHALVHAGRKAKLLHPPADFMEGVKAIIFTESTRTQEYLFKVLEQTAYGGKIVLFNGTNKDAKSKEIFF